jgi:hypothetical protein
MPSAITKGIPRSTDLLAAPHRNLGEKLVPEARQVFRSLDEVVRGILRSLGLCIRSRGPLAGRRGFWQVGSTWQGPPGPWSVRTHGYPCLSSPRSTVGVAAETKPCRCKAKTWRQWGHVRCTGFKKENPSERVWRQTSSIWRVGTGAWSEDKALSLPEEPPTWLVPPVGRGDGRKEGVTQTHS